MENNTAIVLAAGQGRRMGTKTPKQFLEMGGKPVVCYSLSVFQNYDRVDRIILVTGSDMISFCEREIRDRYGFDKISAVVAGGAERYLSVYNGLVAAGETPCAHVFIHDGARPFIDEGILDRTLAGAEKYGACAAGVKVKDTIRETDENGISAGTPDRSRLWSVQTPQTFRYALIREAYEKLFAEGAQEKITDDVMVAERMLGVPALMTEGSYRNIKITTPEDLAVAGAFL